MASDSLTIRIEGVGPYGFRLFGGDGDPLVIAKLRKRSKAWDAGLEEGDVLISINEHSCRNISHAAAMNLVDNSGHYLNLKVLRKGGVTGQLQVMRTGSRQRSLTPSTVLPAQFKTSPSPEPPRVISTTQSVQWSSRVTTDNHQPTTGNQLQQRSFQIHLSEPETERPADSSWNRPSKPGFLDDRSAKQHSRSPSFETQRLPAAPPPQTTPAVAQIKSPAVWKPPSWQPSSTESSKTSFSQEISVTRFSTSAQNDSRENASAVWKPPSWQAESSRTTFSLQESQAATPRFNSKDSKENAPPAVNRSTPSFQTNQVEVAKHKPNVWQPSGVSQIKKTFPVQSPLPVVDSGLEFDLIDRGGRGDSLKQAKWNDGALADGFGKPLQDLSPHLNKILSANFADDEDYDSALQQKEKKKVFVDSSFYNDPAHIYPTVDEQIKMARQVALSLTAPSNARARGHRMFMKRKEKSDKWVVDTPGLERNIRGSDTEADLYYNPTPWNAASTWKAPGGAGGAAFVRDVPSLPPLPTSKLFAPKLNSEDESSERSKALSAEEFERLRLYSQKTTHNTVAPQICFSLAEDLRQSKGKGGRMFAKRRAKSEEWTIEGPSAPDPKLLQKISGGFTPAEKQAPVNNGTESGVEFPPVNRLKQMIELPKPKITPWDAVADYGNVDLAFEHLEGYSFLRPKGSPFADTVANSLQQATQRKSGFPSQPTSAQAPVQSHLSPSWNRPKELSTNNRTGNTVASPSAGFVDFSPSSYGSGSGYRPVHFQSSSENTSTTGGFSDL